MSIYSGSFGQTKLNSRMQYEDLKSQEDQSDQENSQNPSNMDIEIKETLYENEKIKWTPNEAYENCQL